ncbi:MAG: extracellular solute-binding protein [Hyphomicrobium sp.]
MSRWIGPLVSLLLLMPPSSAVAAEKQHAIAMHGEAKFPAGFSHFPYADPAAPKGGRVTLGTTGSFDNLNPLIVRGEAASGVREFVIETLMARSLDEPFTLYGLLAESIDYPPDRSAITFNINPGARFSDGQPVTAADVVFSMELLREKGRPNHRTYYKKVAAAEALSPLAVRFTFKPAEAAPGTPADAPPTYDREMPLIMGLMPVVPKHATDPETFDRTTLAPLIGSGPYRIATIDAGRSITYVRNPDYWGRDLAVNRGRFNFDEIRYDYFREPATQFEAFKIGQIDVRHEDDPARWADSYRIAAAEDGRIAKAEFPSGLPAGMTGLVFNTRRPVFQDARVRQALIRLFNFEWINRTLFHTLYKRTQSFFERSELAAIGADVPRPADDRETLVLDRSGASVKPAIRDGTYRFPVSDGTGHNRENARQAFALLAEAGYRLEDGRLVHTATGEQLSFEILASAAAQERLLSNFIADLKRLGIAARIRVVDSAQYQSRLKSYDYDMVQYSWLASLSPGNEQLFRWSSAVADQPGSYNFAGVKSPAVDRIIGDMLAAETAEEFRATVRALDRVLLSGDYVIPLFHAPTQWVAHWSRLAYPPVQPLWGYNLDTWWTTPASQTPSP